MSSGQQAIAQRKSSLETRGVNFEYRASRTPVRIRILVSDVEGVLGGNITNEGIEDDLEAYLKGRNDSILAITEFRSSFFQEWDYYEPTLSRHLSKSSIDYIKKILEFGDLQAQFETIDSLVNPIMVSPPLVEGPEEETPTEADSNPEE